MYGEGVEEVLPVSEIRHIQETQAKRRPGRPKKVVVPGIVGIQRKTSAKQRDSTKVDVSLVTPVLSDMVAKPVITNNKKKSGRKRGRPRRVDALPVKADTDVDDGGGTSLSENRAGKKISPVVGQRGIRARPVAKVKLTEIPPFSRVVKVTDKEPVRRSARLKGTNPLP